VCGHHLHRITGQREMPAEEWAAAAAKLAEAESKVEGRDQAQAEVYASLERDLGLTGATAIEDLLQEQVADTIALLRRANIRFWMLTGDKKSTARTIGETCALISRDTKLMDVAGSELAEVTASVEHAVQDVGALKTLDTAAAASTYGVIITGQTLKVVLDNADLKAAFATMALGASAVICCRVSPQQKADVVSIVKDTGAITLAVGDGGNDVSMIQKAHVRRLSAKPTCLQALSALLGVTEQLCDGIGY
jgi:phospholipid-translocating ATPase